MMKPFRLGGHLYRTIVGTATAVAVAAAIAVAFTPSGSTASAQAASPLSTPHRTQQCRPGSPTVVLVHGAWADTSSWNGEVELLMKAGCRVRAIANPVENLTSDAEYVADFLKSIHGPVVLVGHSYGGSVITNAAAQVNNVKALVYVDAAAPAVGETNGSLSGADSVLSTLPADQLFETTSYPDSPPGGQELYLKEKIFVDNFGSDLPRHQAKLLWATQRGAATSAFDTPSKYAAWKTIPSWYFISTGDQIITPTSELSMARRAQSRITIFKGGSHLTLISHPQAVTDVIFSALQASRRA